MDQRRRFERFETDLPVKLRIPDGKGKWKFEAAARLRDVSLGGAFVLSGFRFKQEIDDLEVELLLPSGSLPLHGKVVRQPDGGLAIQFVNFTLAERARLLTHFVPESHRAFYDDIGANLLPDFSVEKVSLVLHMWDEWRSAEPGERPKLGKSASRPNTKVDSRPAAVERAQATKASPTQTRLKVTKRR
jgi:hypothetical protein